MIISDRPKGPQGYKDHNACFVGKNNEVSVSGDSGGPILFKHLSHIYLYGINSIGNNKAIQPHTHLLYPTTATLITKEDIEWMVRVGGNLVGRCVKP